MIEEDRLLQLQYGGFISFLKVKFKIGNDVVTNYFPEDTTYNNYGGNFNRLVTIGFIANTFTFFLTFEHITKLLDKVTNTYLDVVNLKTNEIVATC